MEKKLTLTMSLAAASAGLTGCSDGDDYRAAGNTRAAAVVAQLRSTTALLGPPTTARGRSLAEIHAEHEPVVTAVLARDGAAAEAAMRTHLEATGRLLVANLGARRKGVRDVSS